MRRLISSVLVLLCFAYFSPPALADPITIDFTARVTSTIDYGGHLGSVVRVDDTITGRYLYESTTPDNNSLATVGDYWHSEAPFGICLDVNGLVFRTDPAAVRFLVEVVDNHAVGDQYLLGSYTNIFPVSVPPSDRPPVNEIFWVLRDSLGAALDHSALPTQPPTLADWPARTLRHASGSLIDPADDERSSLERRHREVGSIHASRHEGGGDDEGTSDTPAKRSAASAS